MKKITVIIILMVTLLTTAMPCFAESDDFSNVVVIQSDEPVGGDKH